MAIARRASQSAAYSGTVTTTPTVTAPTMANLDVIAFVIAVNISTVTVAPAGMTLIASNVATNLKLYTYYKVITNAAGEPATYGPTISAAARCGLVVASYSGVDNTTPMDVAAVTASNTSGTPSVAGLTTVTANAWLLGFAGLVADTAQTLTVPATMTEVVQTAGQRTSLAEELRAAAGATGTRTWTSTSSTLASAAVLGALRPDATVAGTAPRRPTVTLQAVSRAANW